ncbi:MAG: DHA2 family efflux MFS transporter permease subunit [Acidimicrobiia bacterium]
MTATEPDAACGPLAATGIPEGVDPEVHRRRWTTLAVLCLSLIIIVMDNSILNVAIPSLVKELGATTSQLQWIVDAYVLVFAGFLLTAGTIGDRFGRKGALSFGLVMFACGSVAAALSSSANQLIVMRGFMGFGAAFIMPATLSILTNVFRDPKERAQAIAIWAAFAGVGGVIGPIAGGTLLAHFSWSSVFWINLPVIAIALVVGRFFVPTSRDEHAPRIDSVGAVLSIAALITMLYAIIEAPGRGWTAPLTLASFVVGSILVAAFVAWELRTEHPMLDIRFFKSRRFSGGNLAITLTFFAMFGSLFLLTQFLQFVLGYSPLEVGIKMIPIAVTMFIVAPLSAKVVERIGTTVVVVTGLVLVAAGLFAMSTMYVGMPYLAIVPRLVLLAAGMGLVMAPATEAVMGSLPPEKAGIGSAVNDTTREVGGALGVAVVGSLAASSYVNALGPLLAKVRLGGPEGEQAAKYITEGLGQALAVAQRAGDFGAVIKADAVSAFTDSMTSGMRIGAVVTLAAAVLVALLLPSRAHDYEEPSDSIELDLDDRAENDESSRAGR